MVVQRLPHPRQVFGVDDAFPELDPVGDLVGGVPQRGFPIAAEGDFTGSDVPIPDPFGRGIERMLQALLAIPKYFQCSLVLSDVRHHHTTFLAALRNRGRELHVERPLAFLPERHLAHLFRLARKYFFQEGLEPGPIRLVDENPKTPTRQPGTIHPQQARAGQINLMDRPVAAKGHVAHGGKIVELRVALKPRLHLRPRLAQLLVLHLQLDLVDLQFVEEPLRSGLCRGRSAFRRSRTQPRFRLPAQFSRIR